MLKRALVVIPLALLSTQSLGMDERSGTDALIGTWSSGNGYVWTFTKEGEWEQLNGGVSSTSTFTVEARPSNALKVVSSTGKAYVFHFGNSDTMLSVYPEGTESTPLTLFKS